MPEVVITLKDDLWQDVRHRGVDLELSDCLSLAGEFAEITRGAERCLPETPVVMFRTLGFAVAELPEGDLQRNLNTLERTSGIEAVCVAESFDLIDPVGGFQQAALAGGPYWYHDVTKINQLRQKGFRGKDVLVGVLDSGVDIKNTSQLVRRISHTASFDASGRKTIGPMEDLMMHGTHVCGIIAGDEPEGDEIGVAPDASLAVGRIAPEGKTTFPQMLGGLNWLCENFPDLRIINMSVGMIEDPSSALLKMVERVNNENKLLICAIGNDGVQSSRTPGNLPGVLGVGAIRLGQSVPEFSAGMQMEGGYVKPDLVMPGCNILSCVPGGRVMTASGTSQAAPMLSGFAALILQAMPGISASELRDTLLACCDDLPEPPIRDGRGLPNADRLSFDHTNG